MTSGHQQMPSHVSEPRRQVPIELGRLLGKRIKRVILIGNNRSLSPQDIRSQVEANDLLVIFNNPILLEAIGTLKNPKLFFFRLDAFTDSYWGLPPNPHQSPLLDAAASNGRSYLAYDGAKPPDAESLPLALREALNDRMRHCRISADAPSLDPYPKIRSIPTSAPSSGFMIYRVFRSIMHACWKAGLGFDMVLMGFQNTRHGNFWAGHNWKFERKELSRRQPGIFLLLPPRNSIKTGHSQYKNPHPPVECPEIHLATSAVVSFSDSVESSTEIGQELAQFSISFHLVILFKDGPIDSFMWGIKNTTETTYQTAHSTPTDSPYIFRRFPEIPWSPQSRFRFTEAFEVPPSTLPFSIHLHACVGGEIRIAARILLKKDGNFDVAAATPVASAPGLQQGDCMKPGSDSVLARS